VAAAVRLTDRGLAVAVVPVGPFGQRVAQLLSPGYRRCQVVPEGAVSSAFQSAADAVVLAMWRPAPALCALADRLSYSLGRPWVPVVLDQFAIQAGPAVVPPAGPCYQCFQRRRAQHDMRYRSTAALHDQFDRDAACGPAGYLPHHARLAAGLTRTLVTDAVTRARGGNGGPTAGAVVTVGLADYQVSGSHVVPCHDCERCPTRDQAAGQTALLTLVRQVRAEGGAR
jgi:bacteriocin biosynthesis cyclodehydratase domain-containing protein